MHNNADQLKDFIITCLEEKKAENITVIPMDNSVSLAKYMIFASGRSTKNNAAISDYVTLELKHKLGWSSNIEGLGNSTWVLIDAGEVILHIFHPETREYYKLEELWNKKQNRAISTDHNNK